MTSLYDKLEELYLKPLEKERELVIGVELEFPIVHHERQATDTTLCKQLFVYLSEQHAFEILERDDENNPIHLLHPKTEDHILFEVSYNTLEIAFSPAKSIAELDRRLAIYLAVIQPFLNQRQHRLEGLGINPNWDLNDNRPVKSSRYQMLSRFLNLATEDTSDRYHSYPDYGSFICGNQVQLDVTRKNYLSVINTFNRLEPIKAYLFANSPFKDRGWQTNLARDIFWEDSMHGCISKNVGIDQSIYQTDADYLDYLSETAMFTVQRQEKSLYFKPLTMKSYIEEMTAVEAYDNHKKNHSIIPVLDDLDYHRTYQYQTLTKRGTVEFRSVCTQSLEDTFVTTAFHLGAYVQLDKIDALLKTSCWYHDTEQIKALRRKYAQPLPTAVEKAVLQKAYSIVKCAKEGLDEYQKNDTIYLDILLQKLKKRQEELSLCQQ